VIEPRYDAAELFSEGLAAVGKATGFGFINPNGAEVIPLQYAVVEPMTGGVSIVYRNNHGVLFAGMIDRTGREVIPAIYQTITRLSNTLFAVITTQGLWGLADNTGKLLTPLQYLLTPYDDPQEEFTPELSEQRVVVAIKKNPSNPSERARWGAVDERGKEQVPLKFDALHSFFGGRAAAKRSVGNQQRTMPAEAVQDGKWGFIDPHGKVVVPFQYNAVGDFIEGRAAVQRKHSSTAPRSTSGQEDSGLWGFIDANGKEIVPCKYDLVGAFSEGLAIVQRSGQYGFINGVGKEVIPVQYLSCRSFQNGFAAVFKRGGASTLLAGMIDKKGVERIPLVYSDVGIMSNGYVPVVKNGKWGFADSTGKETLAPRFDNVSLIYPDGLAVAYSGAWGGVITPSGTRIFPFMYSSLVPVRAGLWKVGLPNGKQGYKDIRGREFWEQ
jgi:hypothetical protein